MKQNIYIISGLGADHRVFQLIDFKGYNPVFIKWINPSPNESLISYAQRLATQIIDNNPVIIGISFGGMLATEINEFKDPKTTIILSSIKSKNEIPQLYRLVGKLKLHKVLPLTIFKTPTMMTYWLFGAKKQFSRKLLKQILKETDSYFLKWAIDKIVGWTNNVDNSNIIHIQGSKDRILPAKYIKNKIIVKDGGHLMVLEDANKVSTIIHECLHT